MNATLFSCLSSKLELVQSAALLTALLIAPILILMTEKWATEQSCIHIEITSWKIPSLKGSPTLKFIKSKGICLYFRSHQPKFTSRFQQVKGGPASRFHQLEASDLLWFINIQPRKMGSTSRIHQHTAPPKGGPPLEFINLRGSASRFHQPKGGLPLDFSNQKEIPSTKKGVRL